MKPTPIVLFLGAVLGALAPSFAQSTGAVKSGTARSATHRSGAARRPATGCADMPTLGAMIPKVEGCPKTLYALRYIDTVVGTGAAVTPRKWLTVNYTGYLVDGTKFDSSFGTGPDGRPKEPITFPYGARQVISGWDTGFEGMNLGGKRRLIIPYQLAYGEQGRPPIPAKAQLIFDIELVAISETPPQAQAAPPAPPAGTAPPAGSVPATGGTPSNSPGNAIPATTAPPATKPAPATDPTKPTAIPPTTAPPATTAKPQP